MAVKINPVNFLVAQAAALVLDAAMSTQKIVSGLVGLTLPLGFDMSTITVSEMGRRIDLVVPSGGAYQAIDVTMNYIPGNQSQVIFQAAALNSTPLTTLRFYLKQNCDFAALDKINDPGGGYYIGTFGAPSVQSKNELFQNSLQILPAGSSVLFCAHTPVGGGAAITFTAQSGSTRATAVHDSTNWAALGFEVGDVILADYVDGLNPLYLEANELNGQTMHFTLDVGDAATVPAFSGIAATQLHGATAIEVEELSTAC